MINGQDFFVLHCETGWLTVSFVITDENGQVLLTVDHGELKTSTAVWDYEYVGTRLKIRSGLGSIILDMNLSNDEVAMYRGAFIDQHGDGFFTGEPQAASQLSPAHSGQLGEVFAGQWRSWIGFGNFLDNGFGAIGLINRKVCSSNQGGFGLLHDE